MSGFGALLCLLGFHSPVDDGREGSKRNPWLAPFDMSVGYICRRCGRRYFR
jgi:hypothetical protein